MPRRCRDWRGPFADSASDSQSPKNATATCPAGKRVVGAGGYTSPGSGQVILDALKPNAALTTVTATATEDGDGRLPNRIVSSAAGRK